MSLRMVDKDLRERLIVLLVDNHQDLTAGEVVKEAEILEKWITGDNEAS